MANQTLNVIVFATLSIALPLCFCIAIECIRESRRLRARIVARANREGR